MSFPNRVFLNYSTLQMKPNTSTRLTPLSLRGPFPKQSPSAATVIAKARPEAIPPHDHEIAEPAASVSKAVSEFASSLSLLATASIFAMTDEKSQRPYNDRRGIFAPRNDKNGLIWWVMPTLHEFRQISKSELESHVCRKTKRAVTRHLFIVVIKKILKPGIRSH